MFDLAKRKPTEVALWGILGIVFSVQYILFIRAVSTVWFTDPEFSYGVLIPPIAAYLIWLRRDQLKQAVKAVWLPGLAIAIAGGALRVLAGLSGTLVLSGVALATSLIGIVGFVWGKQCMKIAAVPLGLLLLMVPLPSYLLGTLSWTLQVAASTISGKILALAGVPVYQDGNLLNLPNYVLEVEQACSGSRSIFALIAMALVLGLSMERKWRVRIPLVLAAPILAVCANVVRIVGTGLLAWKFGDVAANESLHAAWGIVVFLLAVGGLMGVQRFLRWAMNAQV